MANIKCEYCGVTINPTANTHSCQQGFGVMGICAGCKFNLDLCCCSKSSIAKSGGNPVCPNCLPYDKCSVHADKLNNPFALSHTEKSINTNSNALTPLGEALQANCPRCNMRWIIHNCSQYPKLLDAKEMIKKLARGAVLKETAENADFFTSIKCDGEEFNVYVNENNIIK